MGRHRTVAQIGIRAGVEEPLNSCGIISLNGIEYLVTTA